jgi:hypothetical protein
VQELVDIESPVQLHVAPRAGEPGAEQLGAATGALGRKICHLTLF